jgi:hypothetical protein
VPGLGGAATATAEGATVTSLNLCVCKIMGFQKLAMKLCANETIKDVFLIPFSKVLDF